MEPLAIVAHSIVSAMGLGRDATLAALRAGRTGLRPSDFAEDRRGHIGRVAAIEDVMLPASLNDFDCRNNRLAQLALHVDGFADAVAAAREFYGASRIAVVLGTSTSGILAAEEAWRARGADGALPASFIYGDTQDLFSLGRFVRAALALAGPALVVSAACASSARAFIDARQLIATGQCDAAVVGGADSLCRMTLQGFSALGLIAPEACRPCDADRAGISVGEAAGFALLERPGARPGVTPSALLLGHGATSDGYHMSTPHPQAIGAIAAMREALRAAGLPPEAIDYVNLHGTGTRPNDAMEDLAMAAVFGPGTPCSSTKGWSGHTLGAAGIVEAVIAMICLDEGLMPGCLGASRIDPDFTSRMLLANQAARLRRVMSNSFGFGGVNCSLILGAAA